MSKEPAKVNVAGPAVRGRMRKRGVWRKWVLYGFGLALLGLIVAGLLPKPIPVEVAQVSKGDLTVSVLEEGKTRVRHRYMISPPVFGYLKRIELRAGDPIEAGKTVLAVLQAEPSSFLNPRAKAEAEARVKGAEAALTRAQTVVERASYALELAEKDRARAETLKTSGAISTKEWETAQNQVQLLTRDLRGAEFARKVAEFELAQAQAALPQVQTPGQEQSKPLNIVAPISGYVLNVMEENARIVSAGTPIMEVGDLHDLEAEIELLSSDAVGVHPGAPVTIEQWGGDRPLRAEVVVVEPAGFTKVSALGVEEQRVKVRVNFLDEIPKDHPLGDRFRVEARIVTWRGTDVLQVPTGALFRRGGDWITFLVEGGRVRLAKVEIGHSNGVAAEVRGGLTAGQTVVLHPPDAVAEGKAVQARD